MFSARKLKGFTLIEIMMVMAIAAVLIGLAIGAISLAQRVARDNQRRAAASEIAAALGSYYASNSTYPVRGTGATNVRRTGTDISVAATVVTLKGAALAGTATDANGTRYCYSRTAGGYVLGAIMEDGTTYVDLSTDRTINQLTTCAANYL